jgi:hypothetical protein
LSPVPDVEHMHVIIPNSEEYTVGTRDAVADLLFELRVLRCKTKAERKVAQPEDCLLNGFVPPVWVFRGPRVLPEILIMVHNVVPSRGLDDDQMHSVDPSTDAKLLAEPVERLFCRLPLAAAHGDESAVDADDRLRAIEPIDQLLVGGSVLNDHLGFSIDGQHLRPPRLPEPPDVFARAALKVSQRVDFGSPDHRLCLVARSLVARNSM